MKKQQSLFIIILLTLFSWSFRLSAQTTGQAAALRIAGEVKTPLMLTRAELEKMAQTSLRATDRNNKPHEYSGVLLATILQKAGVTLGEALKGENLTKYLLVEAQDGYQVLFSLAETDPAFAEKKIILASKMDNQVLGAEQGPFQIIVEGEKRKARFIRQVTSISVQYAK